MDENYYLILELEFDPPVEDQVIIDKKIEEKRKFWATNFNDFNKGTEYKQYHEKLKDIRRIMSDPVERKKQVDDACKKTYDELDKYIKILGINGEIPEDAVKNVAIGKKVRIDIVKKRAAAFGIKIGQKNVDYDDIYNRYYKIQPDGAANYKDKKTFLKTFNKDNFYDFLNPGNIKEMKNLPCDTLKQRAQERKKEFNKSDTVSSSGKKLCETCELVFNDEGSKRSYDEYLEWDKRRSVLDGAKEIAKMTGSGFSNEQVDVYIGKLTELLKDRTLAKDIFIAFCKVEKISYSNPEKEKNEYIKVCRCGYTNNVSDGRTICSKCGNELVIKCPKCSTENDANINVCKCGFEFENIGRVLALCNLAQNAIDAMDFEVANTHLNDAEKYWPGNSKVKEKRDKLKDCEQRIGDAATNMRQAVKEKRYYEAKKQYVDIQKRFLSFKEADLEEEIATAIKTAQSYYDIAQLAKNEKDIIENCTKANERCCDYPGIRDLISKYPPQIPSNLKISTDGNTKTNVLSWNESTSEGTIYYSVVRKRDAIPINNKDGDLVGRINVHSFNDNNILPGVGYYYAIFAERAGVYSKPLSSRTPTVNLFEIANVSITAGDAMLQLEWDPIPSGSTIEVFRTTGSVKEERIGSTSSVSYLNSGLKNDETYNYRLRLAYNVNGQKQMTNGVTISGIPTRPPKAIEVLNVKHIQDNTFQATWENPNNSEVQLYCSTYKPGYKCGEIVSQIVLESKMRRLAVTNTKTNSGVFQFKDNGRLYITAAVIKSHSAVIGVIASARKGESAIIKNIVTANNKIRISADLPKEATGFVVLYRFDKYPENISDKGSTRKYIPFKQYRDDNALVIDDLKQQNYYFSIFSEFTGDNEKDYSTGTNYLFVNAQKEVITYSISVTKGTFGLGKRNVKIDFKAQKDSFILPDIDICSTVRNVPMFKDSSKLFHSIRAQPVTGSLQIVIPLPKDIESETYIKAFLRNESLYTSYQLQLKVDSNPKIT